MAGTENNREWQRIVTNIPAKCRLVEGPACYDAVEIINMHHRGCCINGNSLMPKGASVRLVLDLPFEGLINMTGIVAWSRPVNDQGDHNTGLNFIVDNPAAEDTCMKLYHYSLMRQPKT